MSDNLFDGLNFDNDDINSNLYLYYLNKVNNGVKKIFGSYQNSFLLNSNNDVNYFNIDPYNINKFQVIGDSWTSGNTYVSQSACWGNTLATALSKTVVNNAVSGSSSNEYSCNSTILNNYFSDNDYTKMSSIVLYGFNDYRCNYTLYGGSRGWEYTKMFTDLLAMLSVPRVAGCFVNARDMTQTGTWLTASAVSPAGCYTNNYLATLSKDFVNKRYVYVSFAFGPNTKVNAKWNIYINNVLHACEYQTNLPTCNRAVTQIYTSACMFDLGSNQNFTLKIEYAGSDGVEYNHVQQVACYNSDDVSLYGRHALVLSIPKMGYSYSVSANFTDATETKRQYLSECQLDAVKMCQRMGLNVFYLNSLSNLPMNDDNIHPTQVGENKIMYVVKKYIELNNLIS